MDTIKSDVFICVCAVRHGFHVRKTGDAIKETSESCHSRKVQDADFLALSLSMHKSVSMFSELCTVT